MPDKLDDNGYPDRREVNSAENTTLTAHNGTTIRCLGRVILNCKLNGREWTPAKLYSVDLNGPAISGKSISCSGLTVNTQV